MFKKLIASVGNTTAIVLAVAVILGLVWVLVEFYNVVF